jgi:FKBP-type peptidyl-prolyl cis-trans isomerase FklB
MIVRIHTFLVTICLMAASHALAQEPAAKPLEMKTVQEKASYAIGLQIGGRLRADGAEVDTATLARGIADALAGEKPLLTEKEIATVMEAYSKEMEDRMVAKNKSAAAKNKKDGDAFLAENKAKKGVKTLPSGLQYAVLKAGDGATPKASDTIRAHYHGTLIDGTVFDSSVERDEPIVIGVGDLIQGWQEALQMMKVGSKWKLVIPSELAYGDNPRPGSPIGPGAVLVFELELLGIEK